MILHNWKKLPPEWELVKGNLNGSGNRQATYRQGDVIIHPPYIGYGSGFPKTTITVSWPDGGYKKGFRKVETALAFATEKYNERYT